jgi:hypothetical protein
MAAKFPLILFMFHATGGHAGTICMRLAAPRLQDKRQAERSYVKGHLYVIIIFVKHFGKSTNCKKKVISFPVPSSDVTYQTKVIPSQREFGK